MTWIQATLNLKTINMLLLILLLVCILTLYNVTSHEPAPGKENEQELKTHALTVVEDEETNHQNDSYAFVEIGEEITIENKEPFIPTKEWQKIKPGQAIPRGLHVRLNIQTGEREARLLQEENSDGQDTSSPVTAEQEKNHLHDHYTLEELKRAVKEMKSEKFESVDMETLRKKHNFRSYEELKKDMESINANIKTDAEIVTELVQKFTSLSPTHEDVRPVLEQLEYYLHQIDNALLFCDLGAMSTLLKCLNNSLEEVRSEAALVLGSALQSNPKVQVAALENGAMHELLRILAVDPSMKVRKRAMYGLSTMIRHFPFAQKRFLELGGLSVLTKLFDDKSTEHLKVRAASLMADLVKEKNKNAEHLNENDSAQKERMRQYGEVALLETLVESGWCDLVNSLLHVQEHGSREQILVAVDTMLPPCRSTFLTSVPIFQKLRHEYVDLLTEQVKEMEDDDQDDGFFQSMLNTLDSVLEQLSSSTTTKDEL